MIHHIQLSCPLFDSFRVQQISGMFDVPLAEKLREQFTIDLPDDLLSSTAHCTPPTADSSWFLGLITGPSASGKTTLARRLFGGNFIERVEWPHDRAIIDCFDGQWAVGSRQRAEPNKSLSRSDSDSLPTADCTLPTITVHQITRLLTAVGLSSPPAWIKPHHILSTGEQFRANLARALSSVVSCQSSVATNQERRSADSQQLTTDNGQRTAPLLAFDEFTSTLDRRVARVVSMALAKAICSNQIPCRFVAITCHDDIANWLCPDWIIDMGKREFAWCDLDQG
jgi:ABC-type ATPase with predicted acetyltransferase domain